MDKLENYYEMLFYFLHYPTNSGYSAEEVEQAFKALSKVDQARASKPKRTKIEFVEPTDSHNLFGLMIHTNDPVAYRRFKAWAYSEFGVNYLDDPK